VLEVPPSIVNDRHQAFHRPDDEDGRRIEPILVYEA